MQSIYEVQESIYLTIQEKRCVEKDNLLYFITRTLLLEIKNSVHI